MASNLTTISLLASSNNVKAGIALKSDTENSATSSISAFGSNLTEIGRERRRQTRVVTDSASQLDLSWSAANHVSLLPQYVMVDGHTYREGMDVSDDEIARKIISTPPNQWPQVQAPTVDDFISTYRELSQETSQIISLHVSAHLSDTIRNARIAAEEFRGRTNIAVVDSQSVALGLNILAQNAANLASQNLVLDEIVRQTRGSLKRIYAAFIAEDLTYMAHSGTLRPAQATLGRMLGVIPFLTIDEGEIVAIEKVRSMDRAIEKLAEFAAEFEHPQDMAVLQLLPQHNERTATLLSMLHVNFPRMRDIPLRNSGATIGSIIGPTGIGIMIYEGK